MQEGDTLGARPWDVIVVGGGNAALCAAISAAEEGARTLLMERAPQTERGGNSRFTAGAIRFSFSTVDEVRELIPDLSDSARAHSRLPFLPPLPLPPRGRSATTPRPEA